MESVKIKCPRCHAKYMLKAPSIETLANNVFRCKNCGLSATFGEILNIAAPTVPAFSPKTHFDNPNMPPRPASPVPPQIGENKTQVATRQTSNVNLAVKETGTILKIKPGTYIVGRDSSDSSATLRIAPDIYMSRQHANLSYREDDSGAHLSLTALSPVNPILINGRQINPGTPVAVKNGDSILLGMTHVTVNIGN